MEHLTGVELQHKFGTVENYSVLIGMLACSALIGVFFWCRGDQSSPDETLLGGKSMHFVPVTLSLVASFLSAITLLGMPAEVYTQGTQFLAVLFFIPVTLIAVSNVFLPVFHHLQVPSSYQYLEHRFNHTLAVLVASLSTLAMLFYISIVVYLPAMALEQVTGIDVDIACATIFLVCVFYTAVGGIKAVIWTDVFQLFFMFLSSGVILVVATRNAGGPQTVFHKNQQDGRIQLLTLSMDPRERHTVWSTVIGGGVMWLSVFGVSQIQVQRYLSIPTLKEAKKACIATMVLTSTLIISVGWIGMVLYATYAECDPITAKQVRAKDQILPFLVLHVAGDIPCIPGLFMAGVFSGSLSTISSGLNSLAAIALNDFVPRSSREKMGNLRQAFLTKIFSLLFGVLCYVITFLIRLHPGMLEAAFVIGGLVNGPIIGMFTCGMIFPWVSSGGAIFGFFVSVLVTGWLSIGGTVYKKNSPYVSTTSPAFPSTTSGCPASWLEDWTPDNSTIKDPLPGYIGLYDISYIWYAIIGFSLVLIFSLSFTCLVSSQDLSKLDSSLLAPFVPRLICRLPKRLRKGWDTKFEDGTELSLTTKM